MSCTHLKLAPSQLTSRKLDEGALGVLLQSEKHEAKPLMPFSTLSFNKKGLFDGSDLRRQLLERRVVHIVGHIAHKQSARV